MFRHIIPQMKHSPVPALSSDFPMNPAPVEQTGPPRVTALILSRNCASQLQRCLEALERSEQRATLEILVVDNGSDDGSADIPTQFPEVQTLRLPKDFGRTKATNIGLRTAKGDFIFLVPPHVEVEPDTVVRLADRLTATDALGAVCPYVERWYRFPDAAALETACRTGQLPQAQRVLEDAAEVATEYTPDGPMMLRRLFLRGMNYLDERYGDHWSDLELCWQMRNAGKTILVLPQVRVTYGDEPAPENDAVHAADCTLGAAAYLGKHFGMWAGVKFRLSAHVRLIGSRAVRPCLCLAFRAEGGRHAFVVGEGFTAHNVLVVCETAAHRPTRLASPRPFRSSHSDRLGRQFGRRAAACIKLASWLKRR